MVLFQLTVTRILTVYILQGLILAICIFLSYKTLKRGNKRLNKIFCLFYASTGSALLINFIYAPLIDVFSVTVLNYITNYLICIAPIFLFVFNLILLKSEKVITTFKQLVIILIYAGVLAINIVFYTLTDAGVVIGPPNWTPKWYLPFFLYTILVFAIACLLVVYSAIEVLKKFEDQELKKKWKSFIIGTIEIFVFGSLAFTSNFIDIDIFRTILNLLGFILIISGIYLLYTGVGRQLSE